VKAGWTTEPLGSICAFFNGLWTGKNPPFEKAIVVRNTNFRPHGRLDTSDVAVLDVEAKQLAKRRLEMGDIIIEKSGGGPKQAVGRVAYFDRDDDTYSFSNFTSVARVINRLHVDPEYLLRFLDWCYVSGVTERMQSHSTGIRNLDFNAYKAIEVPVPPLEEQRRIVAVLDEAFTAIATATANAEKNLANVRELFDDFLTISFCGTGNDWHVTTIGEVCTLRSGTTVSPNLEQPLGELPYLKVADMSYPGNLDEVTTSSRFLQLSDVGRNAIIPEGATIFPKRGGAIMTNKKRLVATRIAADLNIMAVIPGGRLIPYFLNYYFQNVDMRVLGSGSSIPQINNYDIEPLKIAIPDLPTQVAFVEKADSLKLAITELAEKFRRKRSVLSELKQSLLSQAFSGELNKTEIETLAA
jgi:type I restriction enzyme S subunit